MKLIGTIGICFCVFASSIAMETSSIHGRPYEIIRDIGFRWRTTLNINYDGQLVDTEKIHEDLKKKVNDCHPIFIEGRANVAAAGIQLVFSDKTCSPLIALDSRINRNVIVESITGKNITCFTTACQMKPADATKSKPTFPPITYNRNSFEFSIPFIFSRL